MINLIFNALKFTPKGGMVLIRSIVVGKSISISVEDNGCGISQEDLPFVFEYFFRADSHSSCGTGIGLALTKQMVEAMGGSIKVSSSEGEGATFTLLLPINHGDKRFEKWISDFDVKHPDYEVTDINKILKPDDVISRDSDIALVVEYNEDIAHYIGNIG